MKTREATAPLPTEQIKEYFTDKDIFFLINYKDSKLQGKVLLTYLSNLDLPADIELDDDTDEQTLFDLIDAYMEIKTISNVDLIRAMVAHIMLHYVGVDTEALFDNAMLTEDQVKRFISEREETVHRWKTFLDSSFLYLIYAYGELNERLKVDENYPVIEDAEYVGHNIVNLFDVPGFMEHYYAYSQLDELYFFKYQFAEHMFKGNSLFPYFNVDNNPFIPLLLSLVDEDIPVDFMDKVKLGDEEVSDG